MAKFHGCQVLSIDKSCQPMFLIPRSRHDGAMLIRDLVMTKDDVI